MFISVMRLCGLFKLNIKVYLELFDSHCLRQSDFYKIVYNSILCGLNQSDGFLFTKMASCTDPSDDLHHPIGNLSHIQSCSHRHAGNTVYWIFMTTCHLLDVCPTTDSQNQNVSPACEDSCVWRVQRFLWVLLHPNMSLAHLACGVKLIFVQTRQLNSYYLD